MKFLSEKCSVFRNFHKVSNFVFIIHFIENKIY